MVTEAGRAEWETYKQYNKAVSSLFSNRSAQGGHDTVGAVAMDNVMLSLVKTLTDICVRRVTWRAPPPRAASLARGPAEWATLLWLGEKITEWKLMHVIDLICRRCGGYADDMAGAVSTTGHGESITKVSQ